MVNKSCQRRQPRSTNYILEDEGRKNYNKMMALNRSPGFSIRPSSDLTKLFKPNTLALGFVGFFFITRRFLIFFYISQCKINIFLHICM